MKQINLKEMYAAGVHLGSSVKSLNPKMKSYVMCTHDGIAIIDILKTYTRLFRITLFLKKVIATEGYNVLFLGTQKSIAPVIAEIATKSNSNYINERWKGGFFTNFKTMKSQVSSNSSKNDNLELRSKSNYENFSETSSNEFNSLPDLVILVGQEKELKAIKECQKLNIPIITVLDLDGDPDKTSLFIPANDDSRLSVDFILKHLGQSILVGRLLYDRQRAYGRKNYIIIDS